MISNFGIDLQHVFNTEIEVIFFNDRGKIIYTLRNRKFFFSRIYYRFVKYQ